MSGIDPARAGQLRDITATRGAAAAARIAGLKPCVRLTGLRGAAHLNGGAIHFSLRPLLSHIFETGARAKAWSSSYARKRLFLSELI